MVAQAKAMDTPGSRKGGGGITGRVDGAVRPLLEREGYDLVLVEYLGPSRILRLYIDLLAPQGPKDGVGIDDCTQVSRWVSDLLDAEGITDAIEGAFNLEVSSPGLDRPLTRPKDYVRFVGREAKLTLVASVADQAGPEVHQEIREGRRRFRGTIRSADEASSGGLTLQVDGTDYTIRYGWIEQARLVPEL